MATFKSTPEDFLVDEIPAYAPSGEGDHLFVRFRKRGRTTDEIVTALARGLNVQSRDIGVAGLKDKVAVTTQTVSVPRRPELEARLRDLVIPGFELLEAAWHKNKLKTGHLRGNRFTVVVRDIDDVDSAERRFSEIAKKGVPNAFGSQRFGHGQSNIARAQAWLRGDDRGPRDPKARRFLFSAWQSSIFNRVLELRIADGSWAGVLPGDILVKHDSGGIFLCTDAAIDQLRADELSVSATGPMIGEKMRFPEGAARAIEDRVIREALETLKIADATEFFSRHATLGEGTRRPLRQIVSDLQTFREHTNALRVQFVLPSGAYATTVLSHAIADLTEDRTDDRPPASQPSQMSSTELSS